MQTCEFDGPRFDVSTSEADTIDKIVDRALAGDKTIDALSLDMDLCATHANGCPMDFAKLLAADNFNFWHDVDGIRRHIDRTTGRLTHCFLPRASLRRRDV